MEDQTPNRKSDTESSEPTEVSSGSKAAEPA